MNGLKKAFVVKLEVRIGTNRHENVNWLVEQFVFSTFLCAPLFDVPSEEKGSEDEESLRLPSDTFKMGEKGFVRKTSSKI